MHTCSGKGSVREVRGRVTERDVGEEARGSDTNHPQQAVEGAECGVDVGEACEQYATGSGRGGGGGGGGGGGHARNEVARWLEMAGDGRRIREIAGDRAPASRDEKDDVNSSSVIVHHAECRLLQLENTYTRVRW